MAAQEDIPAKPSPPRLVNDFAGVLTPQQRQALEDKLVNFEKTTSNQIAIVLENEMAHGEIVNLEDYAYQIFNKWGIGTKENDNGILIYAAIKQRKVRIEMGYGLEPAIVDGIAGEVIRNQIAPNFRNGDYYQGLDQAVEALMPLAKTEFSEARKQPDKKTGIGLTGKTIILAIIFIIAIIFLFRKKGGDGGDSGGRRGYRSRGGGGPVFIPWGGGFGGGGGGFGGGGGGFGGFGGGSSGGGGASGSW